MEELEELRHANELKLAELRKHTEDTQVEIAASIRSISENHLAFAQNKGGVNKRFQWLFAIMAGLTLLLALLPLAYPNGIPWLADHVPGGVVQSPSGEHRVK